MWCPNILVEGEIPPGARIPERDLCARLQISRTPLREALYAGFADGEYNGAAGSEPTNADTL